MGPRSRRTWTGLLGAAAAIVAGLPAGSLRAQEKPPGRFVVMDFDAPEKLATVSCLRSRFTAVPETDGSKNLVGNWTLSAGGEASLVLKNLPPDFPSWKGLRLRVRRGDPAPAAGAPDPGPGVVHLRVTSSATDEARAGIPGIGREWRTVSLDLDHLALRGAYDPAKAGAIALHVDAPLGGMLLVDDVVLEKEFVPTPEGIDREREAIWTVEDVERPGAEDRVAFKGSSVGTAGDRKSTQFLEWSIQAGTAPAALTFFDLPRDLAPYRTLRFRIRDPGSGGNLVEVRLQSGPGDFLAGLVKKLTAKWETVEFPLAKMRAEGRFAADHPDSLCLVVLNPAAGTLQIDDVQLEKAKGAAEAAERDIFETLFGRAKAGKGIHRPTPRFDLYTDSTAAAQKLPDLLDRAYLFVKDALGLPDMEGKLPVYCFQTNASMSDYLERERGFSKKLAGQTPGFGTDRSLVVFFRGPDDRRVVRELAHSFFQRVRGVNGGSWLHEGLGRYVEKAWDKEDSAADFAPQLRGGQFKPLRDLVVIPDIMDYDDPRGGPNSQWMVQVETGALYEFLLKGPLAERWKAAEITLARKEVPASDRIKSIEEAMGMPLADIEKAWVEWGGKAGKGK